FSSAQISHASGSAKYLYSVMPACFALSSLTSACILAISVISNRSESLTLTSNDLRNSLAISFGFLPCKILLCINVSSSFLNAFLIVLKRSHHVAVLTDLLTLFFTALGDLRLTFIPSIPLNLSYSA